MDTRKLLMALMVVVGIGLAGRAQAIIPFSNSDLCGDYLISLNGGTWDDSSPVAQGELAIIGIGHFTGASHHMTGSLTDLHVTYMDADGDVADCEQKIGGNSSQFDLSAGDGTGTWQLHLETDSVTPTFNCLPDSTDQDVNFDIVVSGPVKGPSTRAFVVGDNSAGPGFGDLDDDFSDDITTWQPFGTLTLRTPGC